MIKEIREFSSDSDFFSTKISAEAAAYNGLGCFSLYSADNGVLSVLDNCATLFGVPDDTEELVGFLQAIGAETLLCGEIGLDFPCRRFYIMRAECSGEADCFSPAEAPAIYAALKNGEDGDIALPDYEAFALDYSLRCRRGIGFGLIKNGAVAVASCVTENAAILSGVAVKKDERSKGLGGAAVKALQGVLTGKTMYLLCEEHTKGFYEKQGFGFAGRAVMYDLWRK